MYKLDCVEFTFLILCNGHVITHFSLYLGNDSQRPAYVYISKYQHLYYNIWDGLCFFSLQRGPKLYICYNLCSPVVMFYIAYLCN